MEQKSGLREDQRETGQSLISFLTSAGVGSRRHCFQLLTTGKVLVNNEAVLRSSTPVHPDADVVTVEGQRVYLVSRKIYLKLNKPAGVISTTSDDRGRPTIMDLVPQPFRDMRLFPVGRLDANTTGLLLLTNDGNLANRLTHPRFEVEKEYHVELDDTLTPSQQKALMEGVTINGQQTAPAQLRQLAQKDEAWYSIIVHEGRKRHIRLMCMAVGRIVRTLKRVRIHNLRLGQLPLGKVEELSLKELEDLLAVVYDQSAAG